MATVLTRVKDKVSTTKASMSPSGLRERKSPQGRVIPPEPVQQLPDGELISAEAGPALQVHNLARANKMVPKLSWDDRLAHDAETYAKTLASTGLMEHSGVEAQGENLYMTTHPDAKYDEAVESWMNEEKKYNNEKIGDGELQDYGHFSKSDPYNYLIRDHH
jgi:pathogenesis-related protein 1